MQGVRLRRMVPPPEIRCNKADAIRLSPSTVLRMNSRVKNDDEITKRGLPQSAPGNTFEDTP
jgi:hypothetical protein